MFSHTRSRRIITWSSLAGLSLLAACSGSESSSGPGAGGASSDIGGGPAAGGVTSAGGAGAGGLATTGGAAASGGAMPTGGVSTNGGSTATGGSRSATGGNAAAGGDRSTGGTLAAGGSKSTGGSVATGGSNATGGMLATGGSKATGGTATGGAATGGSKPTGGAPFTGGSKATGGAATGGAATGGATSTSCTTPPAAPALIGWGNATTGGGNATPVIVTSASSFSSNISGSTAKVILVQGPVTISGSFDVGSNKTIVGTCGAVIQGHLELSSVSNVIIRNITIQGYNCTDSPSDCSGGADAISVRHQTTNIWVDHCDIYDGSDGNLDITNGADMVTVSWTKFHYTGRTDPANNYGHMFSNLVGGSDSNSSEDSGHLNVTWHHNWWATNVRERMPRVRFGKNHVFNNLYTCSGDQSALAAGVDCNIRAENNVFVGVANPIDLSNDNSASIVQSSGNVFTNCTGSTSGVGGNAFTPSYSYTLDSTSGLQTAIQNGAGPH